MTDIFYTIVPIHYEDGKEAGGIELHWPLWWLYPAIGIWWAVMVVVMSVLILTGRLGD